MTGPYRQHRDPEARAIGDQLKDLFAEHHRMDPSRLFAASISDAWFDTWNNDDDGPWRPGTGFQCAAKPGGVRHRQHSPFLANNPCRAPGDDHGSLWFNGTDYRYVYHPYEFPDLRQLYEFTERWQLDITISAASWYFPTRTFLIQFDRFPADAQ